MMITIAYSGEVNVGLLQQTLQVVFSDAGVTWDIVPGFVNVENVTEADRPQVAAILAAHDASQLTTDQQQRKQADSDRQALFVAFADSPIVYDLLINERPATMTNDDIAALADTVRYMWKKLGMEEPVWTLNARSG